VKALCVSVDVQTDATVFVEHKHREKLASPERGRKPGVYRHWRKRTLLTFGR